ncbi:hypothetical protein FRC08_011086 [Ceratobasidium sp. 394]|nr:hypothetical protein FRC08_011086 [Ceratobasidium sp. 394]
MSRAPRSPTLKQRPKKMFLNDILAWIDDSDAKALPEYQTRELDRNIIECWIPSTEGTNFKIRFIPMEWAQPGLDLQCRPQLDGVEFRSRVVRTCEIASNVDVAWRGLSTNNSTIRLFSFGKRILTDQEDIAPSHDGPRDDLNVIRLTFRWGFAGQTKIRTSFPLPKENGPIHEKAAKKGHTGSAGLGSTTSIKGQPRSCPFEPDPELDPVVFIFRYAPEDWLQARGIISDEHSSQKRDRDATPDIIDIDDLETDDDDVMVVKHLIPAPVAPSNKRRKIQDKDDTKPSLEDVKPKLES